MDNFYIARADEIRCDYDDNGFAITEVLAGSHDGSIKNYKGFLKAGAEITPELCSDKIVICLLYTSFIRATNIQMKKRFW